MTMTVKLEPELELRLRQRSVAEGRPAGELIREALAQYLSATASATPSAHALGAELFGRHRGPATLAQNRKASAAEIWDGKHSSRGAR